MTSIFKINIAALRLMSNWYSETLRHLMWVDSLDHSGWGMLTEGRDEDQETPDPLVMLAWKCKHLEHLTLFGMGESEKGFIYSLHQR